jgi:hypothetical protein
MRDRGIISWVIEHIRPYMKFNSKDVSGSIDEKDKGGIDIKRDIEKMKGRAEVGIKIRWRF